MSDASDNGALRSKAGPDPSTLTTQQLLRENFWLRELIETRLDGMDRALMLLQAFADNKPTTENVQQQVVALKELFVQTGKDRQIAVDAAFAAQKEAATKAEASFTKQIDASDAKIADLKERLQSVATWPMVMAGASVLIAFGSLIVLVTRHSPP